jgi:hypothetical protein
LNLREKPSRWGRGFETIIEFNTSVSLREISNWESTLD